MSLDKIANKYEVQPAGLNTYDGLVEIQVPEEAKPKRSPPEYTRLEIAHKKALEAAQN